MAKHNWNWLARQDWKVWTIFVTLALSLMITLIGYYVLGPIKPETRLGSIFTSWVGGVALFVVVGVATALASVARPEQESFDARARILFHRQSGPHIDYIISRIKQLLEQYAEHVERKFTFHEYDQANAKFRISIH